MSDFISKRQIILKHNLNKVRFDNFLKNKNINLSEKLLKETYESFKDEIEHHKYLMTLYLITDVCKITNFNKNTIKRYFKYLNIKGEKCYLNNDIYYTKKDIEDIINLSKTDITKKLKRKTMEEKYGGYKNQEFKEKQRKTMIERYGVPYYAGHIDRSNFYKNIEIFEKENNCLTVNSISKIINLSCNYIRDYIKMLNVQPIYIRYGVRFFSKDMCDSVINYRKQKQINRIEKLKR